MTHHGKQTASHRLATELRAQMVEALLDAARERRLAEKYREAFTTTASQHTKNAHNAAHHALELAEQHLTITGETP